MARCPSVLASCYATLALATICLGFASVFFLPWMYVFSGVVLAIYALAWRCEGRWQLTEGATNTLGLAIAFAMLWWILFQLPRNEEELLAAGVPWPAGLLPHLAPLLMILTAVKLFRPKTVADFWGLQLLGAMMVTLASVLAGDLEHVFWLLLYAMSATWWLGASYRHARSAEAEVRSAATASPSVGRRAGEIAAWSVAIVSLGAVLFAVVPRNDGAQWVPHKLSASSTVRVAIGFDGGMDLNRTGKVELSDEVAFEAVGWGPNDVKVLLPADIYWRGETLEFYRNGRWHSAAPGEETPLDTGEDADDDAIRLRLPRNTDHVWRSPESVRPETVLPNQTFLAIRALPALAGNLALAEPIDLDAGIGLQPRLGDRTPRSAPFVFFDGLDAIRSQGRRGINDYGQVVDLSANPAVQRARRLQSRFARTILVDSTPDELISWSRDLLARLPGLTAVERTLDADGRAAPEHRAKLARAVSRHLSDSGEYTYSLNRRRVDLAVDPNVDFLKNVKEGHCERYASGLTLALRGLGIPCRVVRGYRGCESTDDGVAQVRFTMAHSWVQALVPAADGAGFDWILLDPTPSQEAAVGHWQAMFEWIGETLRSARTAFRLGVMEYGSERDKPIWRAIVESPRSWLLVAAALAVGAVVWLSRLFAARRRGGQFAPAWLAEAIDRVAEATDCRPRPSETHREFSDRLRSAGHAALAEPLDELAARAQAIRFGGRAPADAAEPAVAAALDRLRRIATQSLPETSANP